MNEEEMATYSLSSTGSGAGAGEQRQSVRRGRPLPAWEGAWGITRGWAAQRRRLSGHRQTVALLLPGDLLPPMSPHYDVFALTDLELVRRDHVTGDDIAIQMEAARVRLINHAARLAGYEAYERLADLLLETYQRMRAAGLVTGRRFPFPIGQEQLGNLLGMSTVHVNRTLAKLRSDGYLLTGPGWYALPDPDSLRNRVAAGGDLAWGGRTPPLRLGERHAAPEMMTF